MCDLFISVTVAAKGLSAMQITLSHIIFVCMMVSSSGITIIIIIIEYSRQQESPVFFCHS